MFFTPVPTDVVAHGGNFLQIMLLSWLVPALPAKPPKLQSFNSSLHSLPSVSSLCVAQRGITANMTFGGRNTSNNSALMLPASFAKMVTAE